MKRYYFLAKNDFRNITRESMLAIISLVYPLVLSSLLQQ
ncbi:MAG: hypothetical protein HPY66_2887 [Firmicutes bacterium]|nr:hypothetical protein [Bacillota bacterium]